MKCISSKQARNYHGLTGSKIYRAWRAMKSRCFNKKVKRYPHYGGRGITVCAGFKDDAAVFAAALGDCPTAKHSIDRKDNDGHYSCGECPECITNGWPMNCQWATQKEQCRNKRNNVWVTLGGNPVILSEAARLLGISASALSQAVKEGNFDTAEAAVEWLNRPRPEKERKTYGGMTRQRFAQIQNNLNGKCAFHSKRPLASCSKAFCDDCLVKMRNFGRKRIGSSGNKLQKEDWNKVDFSDGPKEVAKRLKVTVTAVWHQMRKRGWRKVYIGPHQEIIDKS